MLYSNLFIHAYQNDAEQTIVWSKVAVIPIFRNDCARAIKLVYDSTMKTSQLTPSQHSFLNWTAIIALLFILFVFSRFAAAIIGACIAAFIFTPVFNRYTRATKGRRGLSLSLTMLTAFLALVIPLAGFIWLGVEQVQNLLDYVSKYINSDFVNTAPSVAADTLNQLTARFGFGSIAIDSSQLLSFFGDTIKAIGDFILSTITESLGGIPSLITNSIIFLYVFSAMITSHKKLIAYIGRLNPLGPEITQLYVKKAAAMTSAMIKGQFVVAAAQGVTGALFLHIAGIHYFALFAIVLSVLSIIPLGGGILTIPIGIIMILSGNVGGGLFILLTHFLIITNIDNVLRPRLVPKSVRLNPALTMISVLAGVMIFGFAGIVLGPVLFIVALTTLDLYAKISNESKTLKKARSSA